MNWGVQPSPEPPQTPTIPTLVQSLGTDMQGGLRVNVEFHVRM